MPSHDYAEASPTRYEVDTERGLLLLDFGTNWCGHCMAARDAVEAWVAAQPTFALSQAGAAAAAAIPAGAGVANEVAKGQSLAESKGCVACHSVDGSARVGPSWKGLYGRSETFADGSSARVDDGYLKTEITEPQQRLVKGFGPVMPKIPLSEEEVSALVAYIRANGAQDGATQVGAGSGAAGCRNSGLARLPSSLPLLPNMIDYRFLDGITSCCA